MMNVAFAQTSPEWCILCLPLHTVEGRTTRATLVDVGEAVEVETDGFLLGIGMFLRLQLIEVQEAYRIASATENVIVSLFRRTGTPIDPVTQTIVDATGPGTETASALVRENEVETTKPFVTMREHLPGLLHVPVVIYVR